jgi:hypothetical protein
VLYFPFSETTPTSANLWAKGLGMAHEISVNLHTKVISSKDMEILVKTTEGKLGTLLVSKGNIEWIPTGNSVNKYRLTWRKFAEIMEEAGKEVKIT